MRRVPVDLDRPATEVAPRLLGATLRGRGVAIRLTEVEAYLGEGEDPGSHAFRGPTPRNAAMFGPSAHLYVYLSYGMHVCGNIVVGDEGTASAVLLRAGEVVDGIDIARARRLTSRTDRDLARGPGRLCAALGITLADTGSPLIDGPFRLEVDDARLSRSLVRSGPRTGVSGEGGSDRFPWRFWVDGDPTVSPYKRHAPRLRRPAAPGAL